MFYIDKWYEVALSLDIIIFLMCDLVKRRTNSFSHTFMTDGKFGNLIKTELSVYVTFLTFFIITYFTKFCIRFEFRWSFWYRKVSERSTVRCDSYPTLTLAAVCNVKVNFWVYINC